MLSKVTVLDHEPSASFYSSSSSIISIPRLTNRSWILGAGISQNDDDRARSNPHTEDTLILSSCAPKPHSWYLSRYSARLSTFLGPQDGPNTSSFTTRHPLAIFPGCSGPGKARAQFSHMVCHGLCASSRTSNAGILERKVCSGLLCVPLYVQQSSCPRTYLSLKFFKELYITSWVANA